MGTSIKLSSYKRDHDRWLTINKKWQSDQKKVCRAMESLEKYLKKHNMDLKKFAKTAKAEKSLFTNGNRPSLNKSLKKSHSKRNRICALQAKSHKNLLELSRKIEGTIRSLQ